jgi:hypothetical protein
VSPLQAFSTCSQPIGCNPLSFQCNDSLLNKFVSHKCGIFRLQRRYVSLLNWEKGVWHPNSRVVCPSP